MEFKRVGAAALLLLVPVMAAAKPVYLKCKNPGNTLPFDVTVDEATGKVSQTRKPIFDAQFTPTEINYEHVKSGGPLGIKEKFTINRQTLELTTVWTIGDGRTGEPKSNTYVAKCEVVEAPERKI